MVKILLIAYLITFYLSIPGLLQKAGQSLLPGLIPFYNLYLLSKVLEVNIFVVVILIIGLISPLRFYFLTLILLFIPFLVADAYDKKLPTAVITLIIPFIMIPVIAYYSGTYCYDMED